MTDHIVINDVSPRIAYVADGGQTVFSFPFAVFKDAQLQVWLDGGQCQGGYTVAGAGTSGGGQVTFASPPAAGVRVMLRRRLALERLGDYQADGIIRAKSLNDELDYLVAALQQVAEEVGRAVTLSATAAARPDLTLPDPAPGRVLKWNDDGSALANSQYDPDAVATAADNVVAAQSLLDEVATAARAAVQAGEMAGQAAVTAAAHARSAETVLGMGHGLFGLRYDPVGDGLHLSVIADGAVSANGFDRVLLLPLTASLSLHDGADLYLRLNV